MLIARLQDRPNSFVAIVKDEAGAEELCTRSPLTLQIPRSPSTSPEARSYYNADLPTDVQPDKELQTFTVYIFPEPDYDHITASGKPVLSKRWTRKDVVNPSFATTALQEQVPKGQRRHGLAWWNFQTYPFRDSRLTAADRLHLKRSIPSKMGTAEVGVLPTGEKDEDWEEEDGVESKKGEGKDDPFAALRKQRITH